MNRTPFQAQASDAEEVLIKAPEHDQESNLGWTGWLISGGVHTILLVVLVYWVVVGARPETDPVVTSTRAIPPPPVRVDKKPDRALETKPDLNIVTEVEKPSPLTAMDLPIETPSTDDDHDTQLPQGREEAVADVENGGQGAFMTIGTSGSAAGLNGLRSPGGRKRAIATGGGSRETESGVEAGLRWLKKHQSPNGMWDTVNYPVNCSEDPKCEPGKASHGSKDGADAAMTGYALMCFLSAGYDHKTGNTYRNVVKRGLEYLLSVQKPDGRLGARNYENAIATYALCDAYAMTNDADLKEPAQKAVNSILACQAEDPKAVDKAYGRLGWDYLAANASRNDSSVTGWNVMALKSALAAGLEVGSGIDGAKNWLKRTWLATNPDADKLDPYTGESRFPYTFDAATDKVDLGAVGSNHKDLACVGMVASVFLGHHAGDKMLETLANYVAKHQTPATWGAMNSYYTYYNTMGMFQVGGPRWKKWNDTVKDILVNAQRKGEGCFDGSWNWSDAKAWPGSDTGRILSTCYAILSLEVYYRQAKLDGSAGKPGKKAQVH